MTALTHQHPLFAWNSRYDMIVERISGSTEATDIVSTGDCYQAMQVAMSLARPAKNDVIIVKWDNGSEKRELAVKVL